MFPKMIAIEQTRYHRTRSFVSDPATVGSGGGGGGAGGAKEPHPRAHGPKNATKGPRFVPPA
jgi:hypothetical protein